MSDEVDDRELKDAFSVAVKKSYQLGDRLRRTPLFKHSHIRKYKRLHEKEADLLFRDTGLGHHEDEQLTFVDHSIIGHFAVGSPAYKYYNSWPNQIVLTNIEDPSAWEVSLRTHHCPFCAPSGRCETLKDLLDHLESHHQDFSYRAKRNTDNSATIMLKVRDNRWIENDVMFRVSTEGYLMSSRMRKKYPTYVPKLVKRRDPDFPFLVKLCALPENYLGIVSQPSVVSANNVGNVKRSRPRRALSKSKSTGMIRSVRTGQSGDSKTSISAVAKKATKRTQTRRVPSVAPRSTPKLTAKRKAISVPSGMGNPHSVHFRKVMFGEHAHVRSAGEGKPSRLNSEAALGRLFSTVTNIPLDIDTFNVGLDSDLDYCGAEREWRLENHDTHIGSFIDVLPIEKYFSVLWNSFVVHDGCTKSDKGVYELYIRFVQKHGGELKRMKLEVVFAMQVVLSWQHGSLDVQGVMEIMKKLRECESAVRNDSCTNFSLSERLEREQKHPFKEVHSYSGRTRRIRKHIRSPALTKWLAEEKAALQNLGHAAKSIERGKVFTRNWMNKVPDI